MPNHPDSRQRSHVDRVILLLQIDDKYVPIAETAVEPADGAAPTPPLQQQHKHLDGAGAAELAPSDGAEAPPRADAS